MSGGRANSIFSLVVEPSLASSSKSKHGPEGATDKRPADPTLYQLHRFMYQPPRDDATPYGRMRHVSSFPTTHEEKAAAAIASFDAAFGDHNK
ncbi:hypothetical protein B0H63DRAFT_521398 [Podospora didyma]|uniref:Uncharacterized protein n=1 Tax=Podospora didyma TaxID=330526 RepID=A0AAE0NTA6_9PEZI|nr:hypothetical protein B0H63DRAFT_521398 [Podospora didyma]